MIIRKLHLVLFLMGLFFFSTQRIYSKTKVRKFQKSDIEFGIDYVFGAKETFDLKSTPGEGAMMRLEYRKNFKSIPIDVGFKTSQGFIERSDKQNRGHRSSDIYGYDFLVSNYHFQNSLKNAYAGIGIGYVEGIYENYFGCSGRVGLKLFRHLNLSLSYMPLKEYEAHASFNVGFFF